VSRDTDAARRSENRERRRGGAQAGDGEGNGFDGAAQAARAAVAAAALGAAAGALRALGNRSDEDAGEQTDEHEAPDTDESEAQDDAGTERDGGEAEPAESDEPQESHVQEQPVQRREREGSAPAKVRSVATRAREQLRELHGRDAESVTALERIADGWRVTLEVVEVQRVPDSTDVLATFVVELDDDGDLIAYERLRRYYRAQADLGDTG